MTDGSDSSVDWKHWKRLDRWMLDDAIWLLLGVDPEIERRSPPSMIPAEKRKAAEQIRQYAFASSGAYHLLLHDPNSQWREPSVTPSEWIRWARAKDFAVPPELACLEPSATLSAAAAETKNETLHPKEKNTLLKLVIGMAIKGFEYDPLASRNEAVAEIAASLEALGIGLDADTVRKKLQEASALLPARPAKSRR